MKVSGVRSPCVAKLQSRARVGSRVIKRYDPARTPAQRLLAWSDLPSVNRQALTEQVGSVNPVRLRHEIYSLLHVLWKQADRPQEVTSILRQRPGK